MANNKEIEVKFAINNITNIRNKIIRLGFKSQGRAFERTIRFDTPQKNLEKAGKFLRLRSGFKNTITFKQKMEDKKYRERTEIELEISNLQKMRFILQKLGYTKTLIMEKYREKWSNHVIEIVIDKLPMGKYIEIEGPEKLITKTIKLLDLDINKKILTTYWELWQGYAKKNGINNENILFKTTKSS